MNVTDTDWAFDRFIRNISPQSGELARANERVRMIRDRINQVMPFIDNFGEPNQAVRYPANPHLWRDDDAPFPAPALVLRKALFGSAARKTQLTPIGDIDMLIVLQCANPVTLASFTPMGLLKNLRETLAGIGNEQVIWEGECVTVRFADNPACDVFPAFHMVNQNLLFFPKEGNKWFRTDPIIMDSLIKKGDEALGGWLRPLIKALKRWNQLHDVGLRTYHLEALALRYARSHQMLPGLLHAFFRSAEQGTACVSIRSPDGAVDDVSNYLTQAEKDSVISKMRHAEQLCGNATSALARNDDATAVRVYRELLGPDFGA